MEPFVAVIQDSNIENAVNTVLDQLKLPDLNNKRILLKPNVGRETNSNLGINTNHLVVAAIFHYLQRRFKAKFFIGDSPIISTDTRKAFSQSGYDTLLKEPGLEFLDMDAPDPITLKIPDGKILKEIRVTGYWNRFDFIITIPVLKMHMHTGASLGFKNCKGLIYRRDKINLHHLEAPDLIQKLIQSNSKIKELDVAIADLANVIKPDLNIIDATIAQEGMGPSSGSAKKLDIIIGSLDYLAADIIALHLVQPSWSIQQVPHLDLIRKTRKEPNSYAWDKINTWPKDLSKYVSEIEPPPKSISIKYPNVRVLDIDSCSACLSTLFVFLKHHKEFIDKNFTSEKPLNLAIGKGIKNVNLYEPTFLIGNCTACKRTEGIFIKGCTPVESIIRRTIEEYLSKVGSNK